MNAFRLLCVIMILSASAVNGESTETTKDDITPTQQPTAEELAYRADTATILKLLGNIRDFRNGSSDETQVRKNARERKLKETLAQINVKYKGTSLKLQRVDLQDVFANDTHYWGVECHWNVPGKYTATYSIPIFQPSGIYPTHGIPTGEVNKNIEGDKYYLRVEIVKTFPNENSVINLRKGSITLLTGKIRGVYYFEPFDSLTIWID